MGKRFLRLMMVAAILATACAVGGQAADEPLNLEISGATLQEALTTFFSKAGVKCEFKGSIDGAVRGLSLMDVPFQIALKGLARTFSLSYSLENGVYTISQQVSNVAHDSPSVMATPAATAPEPSGERVKSPDSKVVIGVRKPGEADNKRARDAQAQPNQPGPGAPNNVPPFGVTPGPGYVQPGGGGVRIVPSFGVPPPPPPPAPTPAPAN